MVDLDTATVVDIPAQPQFFDESIRNWPSFRPFGISWFGNQCFIANNRQLIVFDRTLNFKRIDDTALQGNVHQLASAKGHIWAVSPWTSSLIGVSQEATGSGPAVEFHVFRQRVERYDCRESSESDDEYHINSLLWTEDRLYVVAHNFGPSFILRYANDTMKLSGMHVDAGRAVHGLACYDDELFWISTQTSEVRSSHGYRIELPSPGFARGFAMSDDFIIVATSEHRVNRADRANGDSWIRVYNRKSKVIEAALTLRATGSINDLRLLDTYDYAHLVDPFW